MSRKKTNGKSFALGALVGGLLGGMTALLFAPKSGEKTRKDIAEKYDKVSQGTCELVESICDHSIELAEKAQEIAESAEAAAKSYKRKLG